MELQEQLAFYRGILLQKLEFVNSFLMMTQYCKQRTYQ
jgi:hypothetical protein